MSGQDEFSRSGPHPTHAGNLFDPRVHGEDVSGAGNTTGLTQDTRGVTGDSSVTGGSTSGLTSSEGSGLTGTTSNEKQGLVPTVLSYVGLGGSGSNSNAGQVPDYDSSRTQGDMTGAGIGSGERDGSSAGLGAASGAGAGTMGRDSSISGTDSSDPRFAERTSTSAAADTTTDREPSMQDQRSATRNVTDAPGANEESGLESRGSTAGQGDRSGSTADTGASEEKKQSTTGHAPGDKSASKRENPSSIPIAGGTRVGEAHMGESKIVPDNPKPAGQSDQATADNTAKNAGSGGQGDDAGEHKEGLMGKLKDKLPGHKH